MGQVEVVIVHKHGRTEQLVLSPHANFNKGSALHKRNLSLKACI
jgi:hypothetical protein